MKTIKKFLSAWTCLAVISAVVAFDFYLALHKNPNPTGEQILVASFFIAFLVIFALVCVGAHFEK